MDSGLKDRIVFITGAGGGIGRATAHQFGREGAHVVIADVNGEAAKSVAEEIVAEGGAAEGLQLDVARRDRCFDVIGGVVARHGRVDVLVNNAGIVSIAKIEEITEAEFDRIYDVNVKGKLWCMQAAIPSMKAQKFGRIINFCSVSGKTGGRIPYAHYTSSKAAVWTITMSAAHELAPWNINCNGVAPGSVINTAFSKDFDLTNDPEALRPTISLARRAVPDDIAPAVIFLASEGARYVTGELIDVNGGLHMD